MAHVPVLVIRLRALAGLFVFGRGGGQYPSAGFPSRTERRHYAYDAVTDNILFASTRDWRCFACCSLWCSRQSPTRTSRRVFWSTTRATSAWTWCSVSPPSQNASRCPRSTSPSSLAVALRWPSYSLHWRVKCTGTRGQYCWGGHHVLSTGEWSVQVPEVSTAEVAIMFSPLDSEMYRYQRSVLLRWPSCSLHWIVKCTSTRGQYCWGGHHVLSTGE